MELRAYLQFFWKWLWLVLLGAFLAAGVSLAVSLQLPPRYESSLTLLVNDGGGSRQDYNALLAGERLAQTYAQLVKSQPVLAATIAKLGLHLTPDKLGKSITAKLVPNTELITISVQSGNPAQATAIANTLGQVFITQNEARQRGTSQSSTQYLATQASSLEAQLRASEQRLAQLQGEAPSPTQQANVAAEQTRLANLQSSYSTLVKNLQGIQIANASLTGSVSVVQPAVAPTKPVSPRIPLNVALGGLLGLLVGAGGAFLIEYLDDKVKSPERVLAASGYPTLAPLYLLKKNIKAGGMSPRSAEAEAFRMLRTNLEFSSLDRPWRSLLVTSPAPGDGKSTVASNLAIVLAGEGKRVILADPDLRRPSIHEQFKVPNQRGLTTLLLNDTASPDSFLMASGFPNLRLLTSGPIPPNPAEIVGSARMAQLIDLLLQDADLLILDSPPVLAVADPAVLAARTDATLVVVNAVSTRARQLQATRTALEIVGAHVLGVALNRMERRDVAQYSGYYTDGPSSNGHKQSDVQELPSLHVRSFRS